MRRIYKLLIIIISCIIITFLIYVLTENNKKTYLLIGDEYVYTNYSKYIKKYYRLINKHYYIEDLKNDINNNIKINNKYIKNIIFKSHLIIINIGNEELVEKGILGELNLTYIKQFINNYNDIIKEIRKITDEQIIIVGIEDNYYIKSHYNIIINSELNNISKRHNIKYIDVKDYLRILDNLS